MAVVPLSGSNIRILSGVPFTNDYKHTRWFVTKPEQTNYFLSKPTLYTSDKHTFQRDKDKTFVRVAKSIDELRGANYLMFQNASYNNKWFYAFVYRLEYVNKQCTYVHFQLDVLQTWRFEMEFKPSYVAREHRPLWNSDGTPVINTIDEGLNYGKEYDIQYQEQIKLYNQYRFMVILSKTDLTPGDTQGKVEPVITGAPQPLSVYIVPFANTGDTPNIAFGDGEESYPVADPVGVLREIYKDEKAVNNIVSIYVTEYTGIPVTVTNGNPPIMRFSGMDGFDIGAVAIADNTLNMVQVKKAQYFVTEERKIFDNKYEHFSNVTESKLLMHPYAFTELTDFKGNQITIKNEYLDTKELRLLFNGSLGYSNKVSVSPKRYNHTSNALDTSTHIQNGLIDQNPNDVAVLNDYLAAFLQGNRNSLNTQEKGIMWDAFTSAVSSVGRGGPASIDSALTAGDGISSLLSVWGIGSGTTTGLGKTALQLEAMNSKQADLGNQPPSIGKMGSNTAFDSGNNYVGWYVIKKQIKPEYRKQLENHFHMFGYKTNQTKIPNFKTRQHFNYIQTVSCMILGNMNHEDLMELRSVFDNGITLWHTEDVGNYSLGNGVI